MRVFRTTALAGVGAVIVLLKLITAANAAETFKVIAPSYACKSDQNYSKLIKLIMSDDETAALKFVLPLMHIGECTIMEPGKVFLDEAHLLGNPCVRKRGDVDCYFTRSQNLAPAE
jgi:hypothetical protein